MAKSRVCLGCGDISDRGGLFCSRCREVTQGGLAKRIYVFTPDPEIATEVKVQFEPRGCKVHWEQNFNNMESMMKKDVPDLVVMDIETAGMAGYEYAKEIKACQIPIHLIVVSNSVQSKQLFMDLGADGFFQKPMDKIEFMTLVAKILTLSAT
jgi:DNA-binding response OmpR family regulator